MPIHLACPCGKQFRVKEEHAGLRVKCPGCAMLLNIPALPQKEEPLEAIEVPEEEEAQAPASPPRKKKKKKQPAAVAEEGGFWSLEKGMVNSGVLVGILIMIGAAVWFFLGLAADRIYFYPPIMFIVGIVAVVKGVVSPGDSD